MPGGGSGSGAGAPGADSGSARRKRKAPGPFACPLCPATYSRRSLLKAHVHNRKLLEEGRAHHGVEPHAWADAVQELSVRKRQKLCGDASESAVAKRLELECELCGARLRSIRAARRHAQNGNLRKEGGCHAGKSEEECRAAYADMQAQALRERRSRGSCAVPPVTRYRPLPSKLHAFVCPLEGCSSSFTSYLALRRHVLSPALRAVGEMHAGMTDALCHEAFGKFVEVYEAEHHADRPADGEEGGAGGRRARVISGYRCGFTDGTDGVCDQPFKAHRLYVEHLMGAHGMR